MKRATTATLIILPLIFVVLCVACASGPEEATIVIEDPWARPGQTEFPRQDFTVAGILLAAPGGRVSAILSGSGSIGAVAQLSSRLGPLFAVRRRGAPPGSVHRRNVVIGQETRSRSEVSLAPWNRQERRFRATDEGTGLEKLKNATAATLPLEIEVARRGGGE